MKKSNPIKGVVSKEENKLKSDPKKRFLPLPEVDSSDFYIENGFYVFTEQYHIKRGYCCGNKCRHCPYGS